MLTGGSLPEYCGMYFFCDVLIIQWRIVCLLFCWELKIDHFWEMKERRQTLARRERTFYPCHFSWPGLQGLL